jgi:hypothetical protein
METNKQSLITGYRVSVSCYQLPDSSYGITTVTVKQAALAD